MNEKKVAQKKKTTDRGRLAYVVFLIVVFMISCHTFYVIFLQTSHNPLHALTMISPPDKGEAAFPIYISALEAKSMLPDHAQVNISPAGINIFRMAAKYFLHPVVVSDQWDYFIDFDNSIINPPNLMRHQLTTGVTIYMKPGMELLSTPKSVEEYPPEKLILIFLAVTFLNLGIGSLLLYLLSFHHAGKKVVWFLGTSYIIGILLITIILWLFLLIGGALEQNTLIILWVMAFLGLILISKDDFLKLS